MDTIEIKRTDCLGVCKPGHVMGIADPRSGVYIFNEMDSSEPVRLLVKSFKGGQTSGNYDFPESIKKRLEGSLPAEAMSDIPWQ